MQEQEHELQPSADLPVGGGHPADRLLPPHVLLHRPLRPAAVVRRPLPIPPVVSFIKSYNYCVGF